MVNCRCVLVLKRSPAISDLLFVDENNESTRSDAKRKLAQENIDRIVDAVVERTKAGLFSVRVSNDAVLANDANLFAISYV